MKNNPTSWQTVKVSNGTEMRIFIARPDQSTTAPGVIVLQEAFGVNAHIREVSQRIAGLGYVAVAPELFHRTAPGFEGDYQDLEKSKPHMQALTNELLEKDLRAVFDWLKADPQADAASVAALGYCLGGKAAFVANAILPLKAAASFYGSSIPSLLEQYSEKQSAPLLLFWGGMDKHIDASKRATVAETLRTLGKRFTTIEFSDVGHGFFCDERETYNVNAAQEAWAMLVVFLRNHLQ